MASNGERDGGWTSKGFGLDIGVSLQPLTEASGAFLQSVSCHDSFSETALEAGFPITYPTFYSSSSSCSDEMIKNVFRSAPQSGETIPLSQERIAIMRENGSILCKVGAMDVV